MRNFVSRILDWVQFVLGIASIFIAGAGFICLAVGFNFIWLCVVGFSFDCQVARAFLFSGCVLLLNAAIISGVHKFLDRFS